MLKINYAFGGLCLIVYSDGRVKVLLKMEGLDEVRGILSHTLCWHLSLFCHEDKLLVLWLLVPMGVGTELTEAVEDNVVLIFGAVRTVGRN